MDVERRVLSAALARGAQTLVWQQGPTGEMLSAFRPPGGGLAYRRTPLVSALVHDALACFAPGSAWEERETLDLLERPARSRFLGSVLRVRRGLRSFLTWDEGCDGTWRLFGRASGGGADLETTALAAAALLDPADRAGRRWPRRAAALAHLRAAPGCAAPDRIAESNALRFLALVGADPGDLVQRLLDEIERADFSRGSARYPDVLFFFYCLVRAWSQGHLPGAADLGARLLPALLALQGEDGGFGGPLGTALAVLALVELGAAGTELERARLSLLRAAQRPGGWGYEPLLSDGGGAHAVVTALAMAALAHATLAVHGRRP